jgi:membrane dipeptidase
VGLPRQAVTPSGSVGATPGRLLVDGLQINDWSREILIEAKDGGLSCVHATCAVWEDARATLSEIARWMQRFAQHDDLVVHAVSTADIVAARESGRLAIVLGFQNTSPIEDDLSLIEVFARLGVRVMQLTYNIQNYVGGSCYEPHDGGLTRFGSLVVGEMNRCGMLVDLSHVGPRTSLEAVEASTVPVAITHANPLWFHDASRNKTDAVIQAVAERGGVIGCTLYPLCTGGAERTLDEFCAMVERLAGLVGIEHVAIGSDAARGWPDTHVQWLRNGRWRPPENGEAPAWPEWPEWFRGPAQFGALIQALVDRGFSEAEAAAVGGGNWMRLFGQTFAGA